MMIARLTWQAQLRGRGFERALADTRQCVHATAAALPEQTPELATAQPQAFASTKDSHVDPTSMTEPVSESGHSPFAAGILVHLAKP